MIELRWLVTEGDIGSPEEREAYATRILQFRTRERVLDSKATYKPWSKWQDVPTVKSAR